MGVAISEKSVPVRDASDDEYAAEWQDYRSVLHRVRLGEPLLELVLELGAQLSRQGVERGPRAGGGDPFEDRVASVQDVHVGGLPRVDRAADVRQRVQVGAGAMGVA